MEVDILTGVLLTALGVGGATLIGSIIGFIFKKISHKFSDIVLGFAAGVMLSAAVLGLIVPSLEQGGKYGVVVTVAGVFDRSIIDGTRCRWCNTHRCDNRFYIQKDIT